MRFFLQLAQFLFPMTLFGLLVFAFQLFQFLFKLAFFFFFGAFHAPVAFGQRDFLPAGGAASAAAPGDQQSNDGRQPCHQSQFARNFSKHAISPPITVAATLSAAELSVNQT